MTRIVDLDLTAAEYVLGALSAEDRAAVDAERANNAALAAALADWERRLSPLGDSVSPQTPPDGLWAKISSALDALPDQRVIRVSRQEGEWRDFLPGVTMKVLRAEGDDGTHTFLLRLSPGACVPAHQHSHMEECFVIEGTMKIGVAEFHAGDFVAYPAGIPHTEMSSHMGGVVLIRGGYA